MLSPVKGHSSKPTSPQPGGDTRGDVGTPRLSLGLCRVAGDTEDGEW